MTITCFYLVHEQKAHGLQWVWLVGVAIKMHCLHGQCEMIRSILKPIFDHTLSLGGAGYKTKICEGQGTKHQILGLSRTFRDTWQLWTYKPITLPLAHANYLLTS